MPKLPKVKGAKAAEEESEAGERAYAAETAYGAMIHDGPPGEFEETGLMGADINLLIQDITNHRNLLMQHSAEDKENLAGLEEEIELIEYRLMKIESRVEKRQKAREEYLETYKKTEAAFAKIVQTANAVANILEPPTEAEYRIMKDPGDVKIPQKFERNTAKQTPVDTKIEYSKAQKAGVMNAGKLE